MKRLVAACLTLSLLAGCTTASKNGPAASPVVQILPRKLEPAATAQVLTFLDGGGIAALAYQIFPFDGQLGVCAGYVNYGETDKSGLIRQALVTPQSSITVSTPDKRRSVRLHPSFMNVEYRALEKGKDTKLTLSDSPAACVAAKEAWDEGFSKALVSVDLRIVDSRRREMIVK